MSHPALDIKSGLEKHQRGDLAGAEQVYRSILAECPDHPGAWHLLGLISFGKKQYQQAKTEIERALAGCDTKAVYWGNYGAVLRGLGLIEEAKAACERALAIVPQYPDALSNLALCFRDLGQKERAYQLFRDTLAMDPNHRLTLLHLAALCRELERPEEAFECYKQRIEKAPDDVEFWSAMADLHASQKRFTAAVRAYEEATKIKPDDPQLQLLLGRTLAGQGNVPEAKKAFAEAARLEPDRASWRFRHLGYWPQVFADHAAVKGHFDDLDRQLDEAAREGFDFDWRRCLDDGFCTRFGLTHHGRCCRALKEKVEADTPDEIVERDGASGYSISRVDDGSGRSGDTTYAIAVDFTMSGAADYGSDYHLSGDSGYAIPADWNATTEQWEWHVTIPPGSGGMGVGLGSANRRSFLVSRTRLTRTRSPASSCLAANRTWLFRTRWTIRMRWRWRQPPREMRRTARTTRFVPAIRREATSFSLSKREKPPCQSK